LHARKERFSLAEYNIMLMGASLLVSKTVFGAEEKGP
jgi:hypothetical protein